jgi:hypothetical protein
VAPDKMPALLRRIQRLRLAVHLLKELDSDSLSDDVYRELALASRLQRMGGTDTDPTKDAEDAEEARKGDLERLGLDAARAAKLVKVFEKVATEDRDETPPIPEDYEPPDD